MKDALYLIATLAFFAVMLLYVVGCERLGRTADIGRAPEDSQ